MTSAGKKSPASIGGGEVCHVLPVRRWFWYKIHENMVADRTKIRLSARCISAPVAGGRFFLRSSGIPENFLSLSLRIIGDCLLICLCRIKANLQWNASGWTTAKIFRGGWRCITGNTTASWWAPGRKSLKDTLFDFLRYSVIYVWQSYITNGKLPKSAVDASDRLI